jgi:hypothetical protein
MVFFDTQVCADNKCEIGKGCLFCILASVCWLGASVAAARMDAFKILAQRMRQRHLSRRTKEASIETKMGKLDEESGTATANSASTAGSISRGTTNARETSNNSAENSDCLYDC